MHKHFTEEDIQIASKHMKSCTTSLFIMEFQIKITLRYHYTPSRMVKIQNSNNSKYWEGCGAMGTLIHFWQGSKMVQTLWNTVWHSKYSTELRYTLIIQLNNYSPWYLPVLCLVVQSCPTLYDPMDCSPAGLSVHGDSPGKNTGVGPLLLLTSIFPSIRVFQ